MKTVSRKPLKLLQSLSAIVGGVLAMSVPAQTPAVPEQALREMNIMRNIFDAALRDGSNRRMGIGGLQSLYLAGQGMVFSFNLGGDFDFGGFNVFPGGNFDFDYDGDGFIRFTPAPAAAPAAAAAPATQADAQQRAERGRAMAETYRQRMQDLNEQMREKQEAMRDTQQQLRDFQRSQRQDPDDVDEAAMTKLEDAMEKLGDEIGSLGNSINQLQQEYQSERNAILDEVRQQQTALIFDTLCSYGSTLRSLQDGQHVNVVLRNAGNDQTRVYVVDQTALADCSSGSSLLQAATAYAQPDGGF